MVGINTGMLSTEVAPFGGVKQSGLGQAANVWGVDAPPGVISQPFSTTSPYSL
jgi:acyl-CoA reductase-like NAD-dependent aldehyde dehydrogenase